MTRIRQKGFAHSAMFVVAAVIILSGALVWVYISKSSQLAANAPQIKTTGQAVTSARQIKHDIDTIDIDASLDMSELDAVLQ